MPLTVTLPGTAPSSPGAASPSREAERQLLAAIMRQHEAAVFTYLHRRVRRSVDVVPLTHDVFARLVSSGGLSLERGVLRSRLLQLSEVVLEDFVSAANPHDAAWTVLCLELDQLARSRQSGKSA